VLQFSAILPHVAEGLYSSIKIKNETFDSPDPIRA